MVFSFNLFKRKVQKIPFHLKDSFYQSWIYNPDEKGTNIVLKLSGVKKGVTFDSIIFRGVKMEVFVTESNKGITLESILPSGKSRIPLKNEVVSLPDQLIFHQGDQRRIFLLTTIRRKDTRSYPLH
jgi:hypothetical protein